MSDDELAEWLHEVLGHHTAVGTPSMTARRAGTAQRVVHVRDAAGQCWFVKQAAARRAWRTEVRAYREWVPRLEGRAPRLHAAHEDLRALIVSAVPGMPPPQDTRAMRQAGELLRRLHDVDVWQAESSWEPPSMSERLERLLSRNAGLFTAEEVAFARSSAERATNLPPAPPVACHGDYKRHNWLVDDVGTLRVIDFGEAALHRAAFDFTKLFYGAWWRRPRLAAAFFKGYGRQPDENEMEFIRSRMAISAVTDVCFGRNRRHPQAEKFGRSRLSDLMAGHPVKVARR